MMYTEDEKEIIRLVKKANPTNPIDYVRRLVKSYAREKLDNTICRCEDCPLNGKRIHSVTKGNPDTATVLIVNEGIYESQINDDTEIVYPLENTSEKKCIDKIVEHFHVNPKHLFWINTVNCYTHVVTNGKSIYRIPNSNEVSCCQGFVDYAIEILHPVIIILLGNIPLNMFKKGEIISKVHGQWFDVHGIPAIPIISPHSLLKRKNDGTSKELLDEFSNDFYYDFETAFSYIKKMIEENGIKTDFILEGEDKQWDSLKITRRRRLLKQQNSRRRKILK